MPRYIDADALISDSRICGNCKDYELCDGNIAFCSNASARRAINNAPSADVEPVRHGRWIDGYPKDYERGITAQFKCSECGRRAGISQTRTYKYCPKCGAKMDGGNDNERS